MRGDAYSVGGDDGGDGIVGCGHFGTGLGFWFVDILVINWSNSSMRFQCMFWAVLIVIFMSEHNVMVVSGWSPMV